MLKSFNEISGKLLAVLKGFVDYYGVTSIIIICVEILEKLWKNVGVWSTKVSIPKSFVKFWNTEKFYNCF